MLKHTSRYCEWRGKHQLIRHGANFDSEDEEIQAKGAPAVFWQIALSGCVRVQTENLSIFSNGTATSLIGEFPSESS